ncbi:DUF2971 domain-containing protein [Aeromonas veronii]|uniref:DUF2971 domain-containing protein n=1 Tax=Aeromonas veronii TaxID=654 RepID=UPI001F3F7F8A|nr:DUF2971 domain-containing protein [Aeromonas veronii]UJP36312.1 DUF2971 domain-containing protein [Aeromonas veronii]
MIIYKYSKIFEEFFEFPALKLSQLKYLNDPFEEQISKEAINQNILLHERSMGSRKRSFIARIFHEQHLQNSIVKKGIISFSETPRNLLMWAHYADNHRGMVVGYLHDALDKIDSPYYIETDSTLPIKVNYDSIRYDNEKLLSLEKYSGKDTHTLIKEVETMLLTTKGDEWIYEKEHRIITELNNFDTLKIKKEIAHKILPEENNKFIVHERTTESWYIYNIPDSEIATRVKIVILILKHKINEEDCIFMRSVPESKIHSIHFGHRVTEEYVSKIKSMLSDEAHPLRNVRIEHYKISDQMYSLENRQSK